SLVTFWASRKSLAARRRRNPHAKRISQRPDEGIGPYRGKPEWGGGGGTPQGGFSRPSADSPSAPALRGGERRNRRRNFSAQFLVIDIKSVWMKNKDGM